MDSEASFMSDDVSRKRRFDYILGFWKCRESFCPAGFVNFFTGRSKLFDKNSKDLHFVDAGHPNPSAMTAPPSPSPCWFDTTNGSTSCDAANDDGNDDDHYHHDDDDNDNDHLGGGGERGERAETGAGGVTPGTFGARTAGTGGVGDAGGCSGGGVSCPGCRAVLRCPGPPLQLLRRPLPPPMAQLDDLVVSASTAACEVDTDSDLQTVAGSVSTGFFSSIAAAAAATHARGDFGLCRGRRNRNRSRGGHFRPGRARHLPGEGGAAEGDEEGAGSVGDAAAAAEGGGGIGGGGERKKAQKEEDPRHEGGEEGGGAATAATTRRSVSRTRRSSRRAHCRWAFLLVAVLCLGYVAVSACIVVLTSSWSSRFLPRPLFFAFLGGGRSGSSGDGGSAFSSSTSSYYSCGSSSFSSSSSAGSPSPAPRPSLASAFGGGGSSDDPDGGKDGDGCDWDCFRFLFN